MACEVSLSDEISQDSLIKSRRKDVCSISSCGESGYQIPGNNYITQAQRGKQDFAEGSDINDSRIRVQALQRRNWAASKPILAVVIVFDDPGTGAHRPIEEKHAAGGTHRHTHRILVRWRDITARELRPRRVISATFMPSSSTGTGTN